MFFIIANIQPLIVCKSTFLVQVFAFTNQLARSIQDFWSRWHITLTTWMRDYFYFSLGGNRRGKWRTYLNVYCVFLAVAIWHGTDTKLVLFGSLHFFYYSLQTYISPHCKQLLNRFGMQRNFFFNQVLPIFITFHLVAFTWVVWWADTWTKVKIIIFNALNWQQYKWEDILNVGTSEQTWMSYAAIVFTIFVYYLQGNHQERFLLNHRRVWQRWGILYILLFALLFLNKSGKSEAFIYFQF